MYFLAACLVCAVLVRSIRRSAFGILLASSLIGFLIGACIYPMFHLFHPVEHHSEVADFIARNGEPGIAAAIHVLLISIGLLCGYIYRPRHAISDRVVSWVEARMVQGNEAVVWRWSIFLGVASYLLYFSLVGFDVALMNAAAARGGDLEGFGEKDSFVFLKTVAAIGFVATCFVPMALFDKNKIFIVTFCLLVATAYANSISRNLLLYTAIVPVLVYLRLRLDLQRHSNAHLSVVMALALVPFALWVLTYGKVMGQLIRSYFTGDYYSMTEQVGDVSIVEVILSNYGFQWVSVQAGIDHFYRTGIPLVTMEHVLAAFFGSIPSRVLSFFGVDFLYYGGVKPALACINSEAFGYYECTVPPLAAGYSAYLLPGAGGFMMGFIWLRIYSAIEKLWIATQNGNWRKLWIPYFLWGAVVNFFTFIPSALAMAATQFVWVMVLTHLRFKPVLSSRSATARDMPGSVKPRKAT